jgi:hypothetical protein
MAAQDWIVFVTKNFDSVVGNLSSFIFTSPHSFLRSTSGALTHFYQEFDRVSLHRFGSRKKKTSPFGIPEAQLQVFDHDFYILLLHNDRASIIKRRYIYIRHRAAAIAGCS